MSAVTGKVLLNNNEEFLLSQIRLKFPFSMIKISERHKDICEYIANRSGIKDKMRVKLYINLLFLKSEKAKIITALSLINDKYGIAAIESNIISDDFLDIFPNTKLKYIAGDSNYLDNQSLKALFLKYFVNRVFRVFKRKVDGNSYIRAWVEVSSNLYSKQFPNSVIYLYPFFLNYSRAWAFYKLLFKKHRKQVSLMGVPYPIKPLIKLLSSKNNDNNILDFEYSGYYNHFKDFKNAKELFTTDEFEPGSLVLHQLLKENGCHITNTAHGIGTYSPFVEYSDFYVFNEIQRKFYEKRNNCNILLHGDIKMEPDINQSNNKNTEYCLVLIDQGELTRYNLYFEHELQLRLYSDIKDIANNLSMPVMLKVHPNRNNSSLEKLKANFPYLQIINNKEELGNKHPIFINLYSTLYLGWKNLGKFYFINKDFFEPSVYFDGITSCTIEQLQGKIKHDIKYEATA